MPKILDTVPNIPIQCLCGCGNIINKIDKYGRLRKWIRGHATRNKPWDEQRKKAFSKMWVGKRTLTENPNWKGGITIHQGGYRQVRHVGGYTGEHIIAAEKALGRKLNRTEVVHHIDGNKLNNRNNNLLICDKSFHQWLHARMSYLYQRSVFTHAEST